MRNVVLSLRERVNRHRSAEAIRQLDRLLAIEAYPAIPDRITLSRSERTT
jgi:hypothetical protein